MDRKESEFRKDSKAIAEDRSQPAPNESVALSKISTTNAAKIPSKIEDLLRQGEQLEAMGMYEHAVHVWTRILFLDKNDARSKSAIGRAKRALSERQRELDEQLAAAQRLIDDGALDAASTTVSNVLAVDPRNSAAHQLAGDITAKRRRPDIASQPPVADTLARQQPAAAKRGLLLRVSRAATPGHAPRASASRLKMAGFAMGALLVFACGALYLRLNWEALVSDGAFSVGGVAGEPESISDAVSVPGASELRYYNGARLYAKGRYREALAELTWVADDGPVAEQARSMILRIEERLLRGATDLGEASDNALEGAR